MRSLGKKPDFGFEPIVDSLDCRSRQGSIAMTFEVYIAAFEPARPFIAVRAITTAGVKFLPPNHVAGIVTISSSSRFSSCRVDRAADRCTRDRCRADPR